MNLRTIVNSPDLLTKWIIGIATTAALGLSAWNLDATVNNRERIVAVETDMRRLPRIEDKIDWLINERVEEYRNGLALNLAPSRKHIETVPAPPSRTQREASQKNEAP